MYDLDQTFLSNNFLHKQIFDIQPPNQLDPPRLLATFKFYSPVWFKLVGNFWADGSKIAKFILVVVWPLVVYRHCDKSSVWLESTVTLGSAPDSTIGYLYKDDTIYQWYQ